MNRMAAPSTMVGNEFALPRPRPRVKKVKVEASIPAVTMSPHEEVLPNENLGDIDATLDHLDSREETSSTHPLINFYHQHTFIIIAVSVLIIGSAAIKLGANYWSTIAYPTPDNTASIRATGKPTSGFNMTIPAADFRSKLKSITHQPITLAVGQYSEKLDSKSVKSWLQISADQNRSEYYIHVNEPAMANSLVKEAESYARAPVNQLTVNEDGTARVVLAGQNGRALSDPNSLRVEAKDAAKNVLAGKGLQFNTPLKTQAYSAVTPVNFKKLIVVNLTSKKMWAYQDGKVVKTFLVSAGKPSTPTPTGEFHIWTKLTKQTMVGPGYVQPDVPWVNYFDHSGDAIHGVYWRPSSVFGHVNTSHGCVGISLSDAQWMFNWAPVGTTVVTHD